MSSSTSSDAGVDVALLERRLEGLRDTQESVQGLSIWCQANKKFATAIIETWLKCLRKSPVEKRLTLFYLANDVVQHAKRKGDTTLINQWAVAVQKATPHVRSPSSISSAIARIFKIWEERNVYSRDAVVDLLALLNTASGKEKKEKRPSAKKPETYTASAEKVQKFDPSTMISKVKVAYKLKSHLGNTFRTKHYFNMKMDQLIGSIKDRQHGMEVIQELAQLLEECKNSEHKLQTEVEERRKLVEIAEIGIVSYENVRGEAGIVNTAYKNFTNRVESTKEKVDEKLRAFQAMESPEPDFGTSSTNSDALRSINLPPNSQPKSAEKPFQYSNYSSSDQNRGDTESYQQQSLYNPSLPTLTTGYDISAPPWTNDTYTSMMSSMMQMQYQPPPQLPQEPAANPPPGPPPVFTLTPSMQLQMQMQQQQVVTIQQQFQPPQAYNSINNNYHSPQPGKTTNFGAGDLVSIPLPPPENPPLPPEPHHNVAVANNSTLSDPYHPPLPSEYTSPSGGHQSKHDSSFDSTELESPPSYRGQQPQYPYNNSQDASHSYSNRSSGGSGGAGFASTPRPQFNNAGPRFPHQRSNSSGSFNGYNDDTEVFDHSSQGNMGNGNGSQPLPGSGPPSQNYSEREFDNSEANLSLNGGDEPRVGAVGGGNMYNNSSEFYDRSYNSMGMDTPPPQRMPMSGGGPHKPRMFQPNWRGGGRARPPRPPFPYDGGSFRRGSPGRGMRGGFDRGARRGFR